MSIAFSTYGSIPTIGLGTWPMDDSRAEVAVASALDLGYRLLDTAYAYGNEVGVGRGLAASGVAREDVFVTTKFNKEWPSIAGVAETTEASMRRLGLDYLDLLLVHWPNPDQDQYVEAWEGLIAVRERGLVRHIGVSNFMPEHIDRLVAATGVTPELDQVQINPRWAQPELRAYNAAHGILTQSWRPLGMGGDLLELPLIVGLARTGRDRLARRARTQHDAEVGGPGAPGRESRRGLARPRGRRRRGAVGSRRHRARRDLAVHLRALRIRSRRHPLVATPERDVRNATDRACEVRNVRGVRRRLVV